MHNLPNNAHTHTRTYKNTHTHTYQYTHTHVHVHAHTHTSMHTLAHMSIHTLAHMSTHPCTLTHPHMSIHTCPFTRSHICPRTHPCTIHTHSHTFPYPVVPPDSPPVCSAHNPLRTAILNKMEKKGEKLLRGESESKSILYKCRPNRSSAAVFPTNLQLHWSHMPQRAAGTRCARTQRETKEAPKTYTYAKLFECMKKTILFRPDLIRNPMNFEPKSPEHTHTPQTIQQHVSGSCARPGGPGGLRVWRRCQARGDGGY
jgi:hypothetical protein